MDMELRLFTDMPFIGGFVFELANCGAATSVIISYTLWSHYYIQLGLALNVQLHVRRKQRSTLIIHQFNP